MSMVRDSPIFGEYLVDFGKFPKLLKPKHSNQISDPCFSLEIFFDMGLSRLLL